MRVAKICIQTFRGIRHLDLVRLAKIKEQKRTPEYLSVFAKAFPKKKTRAAAVVAAAMIERRTEGVSTLIRGILERAFALAGGAKQWHSK